MSTTAVILTPQGRLDAATVRPFEAEWKKHLASGHARLVVDLTETRSISSSGLRTLLAAAKSAKRSGGAVKLCGLNPRLKEVFEMAGFDRVFEIYPTRDQAQAAFE